MGRITLKQKLFIKAYLSTKNGTEAAYRVYRCRNRAVAAQISYENLRKPEIHSWVRLTFMSDVEAVSLAIQTLVDIARKDVSHVKGTDVIKANQILLQMAGYL